MAKTFLQLCNDVKRESRVTGSPMASVVGNTGLLDDIVNWVRDAWVEIQNERRDWRWMRKNFRFETAAAVSSYAYSQVDYDVFSDPTLNDVIQSGTFSHWWVSGALDRPRSYLKSGGVSGEGWLYYLPYDAFRTTYLIGALATNPGQPVSITVDNLDRLVLHPVPNDVYVVRGEFQQAPEILSTDSQVPSMPGHYHDLIRYRAMERYGGSNIAGEVISRSITEGGRLMAALELEQLVMPSMGAPLA